MKVILVVSERVSVVAGKVVVFGILKRGGKVYT